MTKRRGGKRASAPNMPGEMNPMAMLMSNLSQIDNMCNRIFFVLFEVINPFILISLGLFVSIGYITTKIIQVSINEWMLVFVVMNLISLAGIILYARRLSLKSWEMQAHWWQWVLFLVPLAVTIPTYYVYFTNIDMQLQGHLDIHLGLVHQLMYRIAPPENVFLSGYPANYYWLFHAYVATVSQLSRVSPATVLLLVNILTMISAFFWIAKVLVSLGLVKPTTLYWGFATAFVFFSLNLPGVLHGGPEIWNEPFTIASMRKMIIDGGDRHLHSLLAKFFQPNSSGSGFISFSVAFYAILNVLKKRFGLIDLVLISATGIVTLAMHQTTAMFIVFALIGGYVVATLLYYAIGDRQSGDNLLGYISTILRQIPPLHLGIWFIVSVFLSFPLLKYNSEISYNYQSTVHITLINQTNLNMIFAAVYALIPAFIIFVVMVVIYRKHEYFYVLVSTSIIIAITATLSVMEGNEYKGVYLIAIMMAITFLYVIQWLQQSPFRILQGVAMVILLGAMSLSTLNIAYTSLNYSKRPDMLVSRKSGFVFDGLHILATESEPRRVEAYYWIRENTPYDSVIVAPIRGYPSNMLYERITYVRSEQFEFVDNIPEYDVRYDQVEHLYTKGLTPNEYREVIEQIVATTPDRPIYAVIRDRDIPAETMEALGAIQVFDNPTGNEYDANVYLLQQSISGA